MARISYQARQNLPKSNFAIPSKAPGAGSYPIDTANRARNALSRVSQFGNPSQQSQVKSAVHSKYPQIDNNKRKNIVRASMAKRAQ